MPEYGFSLIIASTFIRENTDQKKPVFWYILCSVCGWGWCNEKQGILQRQSVFYGNSALKYFAKFPGKHLYKNFFLKLCAWNFITAETFALLFSCEFCETDLNNFFIDDLWATASDLGKHQTILTIMFGFADTLWKFSVWSNLQTVFRAWFYLKKLFP